MNDRAKMAKESRDPGKKNQKLYYCVQHVKYGYCAFDIRNLHRSSPHQVDAQLSICGIIPKTVSPRNLRWLLKWRAIFLVLIAPTLSTSEYQ